LIRLNLIGVDAVFSFTHFHHDSFMTGYSMNRTKYDLKDWKREIKINDLGL